MAHLRCGQPGVPGLGASIDGFTSWGILTLIGLIAVVAFYVIRSFMADAVKLPDLPVTDAQAYMIGGGVEALGGVLFWLAYRNELPGYLNVGVRYGTFIALVGGVITAYGGYLKQSEPAPAASSGSPAPPPAPPSYTSAPPPPAAPPPPPPPSA